MSCMMTAINTSSKCGNVSSFEGHKGVHLECKTLGNCVQHVSGKISASFGLGNMVNNQYTLVIIDLRNQCVCIWNCMCPSSWSYYCCHTIRCDKAVFLITILFLMSWALGLFDSDLESYRRIWYYLVKRFPICLVERKFPKWIRSK